MTTGQGTKTGIQKINLMTDTRQNKVDRETETKTMTKDNEA